MLGATEADRAYAGPQVMLFLSIYALHSNVNDIHSVSYPVEINLFILLIYI